MEYFGEYSYIYTIIHKHLMSRSRSFVHFGDVSTLLIFIFVNFLSFLLLCYLKSFDSSLLTLTHRISDAFWKALFEIFILGKDFDIPLCEPYPFSLIENIIELI